MGLIRKEGRNGLHSSNSGFCDTYPHVLPDRSALRQSYNCIRPIPNRIAAGSSTCIYVLASRSTSGAQAEESKGSGKIASGMHILQMSAVRSRIARPIPVVIIMGYTQHNPCNYILTLKPIRAMGTYQSSPIYPLFYEYSTGRCRALPSGLLSLVFSIDRRPKQHVKSVGSEPARRTVV